jgi:hypothetical protein
VIAVLALLASQPVEPCPALLTLNLPGRPSLSEAQAYADCMTRVSLPTADQNAEKRNQCAPDRAGASERLSAWVDQMAVNFPGCETRLTFRWR